MNMLHHYLKYKMEHWKDFDHLVVHKKLLVIMFFIFISSSSNKYGSVQTTGH